MKELRILEEDLLSNNYKKYINEAIKELEELQSDINTYIEEIKNALRFLKGV